MQQNLQYSYLKFRFLITLMINFCVIVNCTAQFHLRIKYLDKDTAFKSQVLKLQTNFNSQILCAEYINKLPKLLNSKGYAAVSIDSIFVDTSFILINLYLGKQQNWIRLATVGIDKKVLDDIGFYSKNFENKPFNPGQIDFFKNKILNYYENNGYPFAAVFLDSLISNDSGVTGLLNVKKGPLYHIDSISINGKISISNAFLQHYLGIPNGSFYNKEKLQLVSKKLLELPYLKEQQPAELRMLGTGSILDLYLQTKRSSQINFLVGFLPAGSETGKLKLTGDINLNLKNALGTGETILVNWQQLQQKSPRLNLGFQQPYIFKSPFGIDFSFEIFKKDSAFVQLNAQLGLQYLLSANQSGKLFIQKQNTFLLSSGIDTNLVKATKMLPFNIDVSAVNIGIDYEFNNTNYRFNPRTGNQIKLVTLVGLKTISKNDDIINLTDPNFKYAALYDGLKLKAYQLKLTTNVVHYIPLGKRSTLKTVVNGGIFNSPNIFRNELFQLGGNKLLRGFNEESIYATQYAVATAEYHYLIGLNSYFLGFIDAGWVKNKYQLVEVKNNFSSAGIGLVFETKVGLLNLSFAVGKRNDIPFNLSQSSKIHFGYINYF